MIHNHLLPHPSVLTKLPQRLLLPTILSHPPPFQNPRAFKKSTYTTTTPTTLPEHNVVSSFLCTSPHPKSPTFLLSVFKRSPSARLYPSLWAACSGSINPSIDASPRVAALREIREETGLKEDQVQLLKEGESYEIIDENLGKKWHVWVFAWVLLRKDVVARKGNKEEAPEREREMETEMGAEEARGMITLNQEHTEVRFVRPEEVDGMQTVDSLGRSVRKVLEGVV